MKEKEGRKSRSMERGRDIIRKKAKLECLPYSKVALHNTGGRGMGLDLLFQQLDSLLFVLEYFSHGGQLLL